ncbi:MAG: spore maturation protein [Oscillospiraceae bacterium]|nr:spore maturation protein [Oscillospiraceae bacterium]
MSDYVVPLMILGIIIFGLVRRVPVYDTFLEGAKTGLDTALAILPTLIAMLVFISMLVSSGALNALMRFMSPLLRLLGIPEGALAVMIVRPFSGSAALAMLEQTFRAYGVDSIESRAASAMMGSSETIFYTLPLYLAAAKVRKSRYAVPAALVAWLVGCAAAAWACKIWV